MHPTALHRTDRPLRVALFTEQGHPEGRFTSGVTRITRRLWRYCRERALPLDVFTYHDTAQEIVDGSVWCRSVRPRTAVDFHGLRVDPWDILPVRNRALTDPALREGRYDVVLATAPGIGTQASLVAERLGVPLVMLFTTDLPSYAAAWVRDATRGARALTGLARAVERAAWSHLEWLYHRSRTELVLTPTRAFRREVEPRITARVAVLGRGSDTLAFAGPAALDAHTGPPTLLYVGRLDYGQKNLATLCRAVREIPECNLLCVGDGEHRERLAAELGDEIARGRVRLAGRIDDPEALRAAYRSADVFAFPSVHDTLGQVVVEAQRAGLPVVVRDRGGPRELIEEGVTGFAAPSDDAFVARCRELVRDAALRVRMGRAAWDHAARLPTWDQVIERLLAHLRSVAERGRARLPWLPRLDPAAAGNP
jgi:glycosyltransferase involved in cell wall biosynthesis